MAIFDVGKVGEAAKLEAPISRLGLQLWAGHVVLTHACCGWDVVARFPFATSEPLLKIYSQSEASNEFIIANQKFYYFR